jgi:hypothetical protein
VPEWLRAAISSVEPSSASASPVRS